MQIIALKGSETLKAAIAVERTERWRSPEPSATNPRRLLSDDKHVGQRARRGAAVGLINQPVIEAVVHDAQATAS